MPPIQMKKSPRSSAQSQTLTLNQVRDATRAAAIPSSSPPPQPDRVTMAAEVRFGPRIEEFAAVLAESNCLEANNLGRNVLCYEEIDGRRWSYVVEPEASRSNKKKKKGSSLRACLVTELMSFIRSYVVPEGFPDSVTPSYVPYMTWRALKAHVLLHFIRSANVNQSLKKHTDSYQLEIKECLSNNVIPTNSQFLDHIAESCRIVSSEYGVFKRKAADQGWIMSE